jgi:hypothetical protein
MWKSPTERKIGQAARPSGTRGAAANAPLFLYRELRECPLSGCLVGASCTLFQARDLLITPGSRQCEAAATKL